MTKKMYLALLAGLALSGGALAADFQMTDFSPADLLAATQASLKLFSDSNPSHVVHLSGFKAWKSGADAKVKIYVNHDGMAMEYNYNCVNAGGQVRCVAAQ